MKSNLSIIDADSLIYLVGSKYKDVRIRSSALNDLDKFIIHILKVNYSKYYVGFFGKMGGSKNFRYDLAKTKPYKGNRPEKTDWYKYWERIMKNHMEKVWGFVPVEHVEADDMCSLYAEHHRGSKDYDKIVICSPDKDLEQVGETWIYDYRTHESEYITALKGEKNLYRQCIQGDSTDNILGLEGVGKVTAKEFVAGFTEVKGIREATLAYYKEYIHVTGPKKERKKAEKIFLASYKTSQGLKRYTKKTKAAALQMFGTLKADISTLIPPDHYKKVFAEMYSLVYMLRTEAEVKVYWPEFKFMTPLAEKYMDWEEIDANYELIHGEVIEENFDEDLTFLSDDDFDLLDDNI